jgi:FlaA1/EpsC-like NDP-sugar epimerase
MPTQPAAGAHGNLARGCPPSAPAYGRGRPKDVPPAGSLEALRVRAQLAFGDAIVIAVASLAAYLTREAIGRFEFVRAFGDEIPITIAITPLWLLLFYLAGAYRPEYLNAGGDALRRFVAGVAAGVFALGFTSFLLNLQLARLFVAFVAIYVLIGGALLRAVVRRHIRRRHAAGELVQRALVVGTDDDARQLVTVLDDDPDSTYQVVGYLDEAARAGGDVDGKPVLGTPAEAVAIAEKRTTSGS